MTAADGREARLVIWRGGWADVDLLAGGTVITRNPDLDDPAGCAALASSIASELTAPPLHWGPDLRPVTIVWVDDWWDGPVEGMATYQGRDCWFRAIFDTEADEWTSPRRCRLLRAHPRRTRPPAGPAPPAGTARRREQLLPPRRTRPCPQARRGGLP